MHTKIKHYVLLMVTIFIISTAIKHLFSLTASSKIIISAITNILILSFSLKSVSIFLRFNSPDDVLSYKKWFLFGCFYFILTIDQLSIIAYTLHFPLNFIALTDHILSVFIFIGITYALYYFIKALGIYKSFPVILRDVILMAIPFFLITFGQSKSILNTQLLIQPTLTYNQHHTFSGILSQASNLLFGILFLILFMASFYILPCQRSNRFILLGYFILNGIWFFIGHNPTLSNFQLFELNQGLILFLFLLILTLSMAFNLADNKFIIQDMHDPYTYLNTFWTTIIIGLFPILFLLLSHLAIIIFGGKFEFHRFGILTVVSLLLIIFRDIYIRKENHKLLQTIKKNAKLDPLTNINNRRGFFEDMMNFTSEYTLFFFDVKQFKQLNDSHGHDIGDDILKDIATVFINLEESINEPMCFGRFGGDEFLLALGTQNQQMINTFCDIVSAKHYVISSFTALKCYYSLNIGYTLSSKGESINEFITQADIAMYKCKHTNATSPVMFNEQLRDAYRQEIMVKNDLSKAISEKAIQVVFQPKFDLQQLNISGFETLARWSHPIAGMISPLTFVQYAEELGLAYELDLLIIKKACAFQHKLLQLNWFQKGAINVSLSTIHHPQFIQEVKKIITYYDISANLLTFEILENVNLDEAKTTLIQKLEALRQLGFKISIDDFGTAYSSLNRLYEIPVDELKIPREFVLTHQFERQLAIIKAIKVMAQNLNIQTVVEGIETEEQFNFFKELGFDYMQGYYIAKPLSDEEFIQRLI